MRLWTIHPKYLDAKGLVAVWREGLLAQKVLQGGTRGYTRHPQLLRFSAVSDPVGAVATFLAHVHQESLGRGYRFDQGKIATDRFSGQIEETEGQLAYEWSHLRMKLKARAPSWFETGRGIENPEPHPLFKIIAGDVRSWEKRPGKNLPVKDIVQAPADGTVFNTEDRSVQVGFKE